MPLTDQQIRAGAERMADDATDFLRDLIRTPSMSGREERAVALIHDRMTALYFDEVKVDPFGNVWGRIGHGRRVVAFDAHVDTVDVGDRSLWQVDPFGAEIVDGVVYGRGASDQKAGMAALVYTGALLKQLAWDGDLTLWFVGSVLEEDCDGLCWHYILNEGLMRPDLVVLTEPTDLQVYRGQRGRMELEVTLGGLSCHGSAPERGVNAIHRMAPVLQAIGRLGAELADDPFLGRGTITTSEIRSQAPSLCAVADACTIHLDRRLTFGETDATAIAEIERILAREAPPPAATTDAGTAAGPGVAGTGAAAADGAAARIAPSRVEVPLFQRPSHTGLVYPMRQYFPAWTLPEDDPLLAVALDARRRALGEPGTAGKWTFSTNGVATCGLHGVPTIGFGPANEIHAHAPTDQCPVAHVGRAIAFYTTLVSLLAARAGDWPGAKER
ncbi:MAG: YgeY family selenium metabolism-linked hydrolase [Candidatus Krumholzibacteriia bacterium]